MRKLILLLAAGLLASCGQDTGSEGCRNDGECQPGFICEGGSCLCPTDDVCGEGQYCNPFGTCQVRPACLGNFDCDDGFICNSYDSTGGRCIPAEDCGSSVHCRIGEFCSPQTQQCTPGCRKSGDCQLGRVCVAGQCQPGGISADCTVCPADPGLDASYCNFGEVCSLAGTCQAHSSLGSLCATCDLTDPFNPIECPGDLICLIDNDEPDHDYCTTTCNNDNDCPNGYRGCGKVQLVDPSTECTNTGTCANGAPCLGGAESQRAFCGCISDSECSMGGDFCDNFFTGGCANTGWPCQSDADCAVSCVQIAFGDGTAGVCLTDKGVCGKEAGYFCSDLTSGDAACIDYLP